MMNSWTETLDGYSIVKNKDGIYEYAQENNGELVSSGFLVVEDSLSQNKKNFLKKQLKHLRPIITTEKSLNIGNVRVTDVDDSNIHLTFPKEGTHKILVLLIDFPDLVATHTVNEFEDFELRLSAKFKTNDLSVNGGICFRAKRVPKSNEVMGYQADIGFEKTTTISKYLYNQSHEELGINLKAEITSPTLYPLWGLSLIHI